MINKDSGEIKGGLPGLRL